MRSKTDIEKALQAAAHHCQNQKKRLTQQREKVLSVILSVDTAMTAYQLLDLLKKDHLPNAHPPTIYRALEFLIDSGLIHRIEANNSYIACDHIQCSHAHQPTQFLLCDVCGSVAETTLKSGQLNAMKESAKQYGFSLNDRSLELHGVCQQCQATMQ
ncbi:MAG: transcriptional repressor [Gammaproteobacteria bacterium]|nr:transcriptional repressor [Gammaproteobacteria bacterium]